ncbi:hypothetical protein LJC17_02295 [Acholeplasma sp. OttesenSCG-928-E16]|nr:hypothetical protein [Acholeplasma sp. OttesenSCG-928-E16]
MKLTRLSENDKSIYTNKNFTMRELNFDDFININVSEKVKEEAIEGSKYFKKRIEEGKLFPKMEVKIEKIDLNSELLIHNYTGSCPIQTYEINPVLSCNVGCAYCLVDDGIHQELIVYENYHELVRKKLEQYYHEDHYFYFSPKTEAFCEATLQTGIAHKILLEFINHYKKRSDSKIRLFIASKAGVEALNYQYDGVSILDLFKKLKGKMQFNTSLSIFPNGVREYLEPYAASYESRLEAVKLCQENGIMANSALVQPILISVLNDELLDDFFKQLNKYHIINIKPEFLTANIWNMTLLASVIKEYDPDIFKKVFETYFNNDNLNHVKQRSRTAPSREKSIYWIEKIKKIAAKYGISISICFWVRKELKINENEIPIVNENGFKCLGYQTKLFKE